MVQLKAWQLEEGWRCCIYFNSYMVQLKDDATGSH